MKTSTRTAAALFTVSLVVLGSGCDSSTKGTALPMRSTTQVDRLARPAINEGLIVTNAYLNAFNSIPPSADFSGPAAPVRTEAVASLTAFANLGATLGTSPAPAPGTTVGAFLPDVMRIDTRTTAAPGTTAYNASASGSLGILTGGRKPEDDVMDITLSFLVAGDASGTQVKDNVAYEGVAGNVNQPGHKMLTQQTMRRGPAQFPFLAMPN